MVFKNSLKLELKLVTNLICIHKISIFSYILLTQNIAKPEDLGFNPWAPQGEMRESTLADVL